MALLLGLVVTRAVAGPVRRLSRAIDDVAASSDLTRRVNASGGDELSMLASRFNDMMSALEASTRAQRQLVDDASHELRTPLTSLRTNMDVLLRAEERLTPEQRRALMEDLSIQLDELGALVADLVELAKGATPDASFTALRLDGVVADAVARVQRMAPGARFELQLEPSTVNGSEERLHRAIGNLLTNAVAWNSVDEPITVTCERATVCVRDHGPGVSDEDKAMVFDRFFRASEARDRPGSGLGLAIARTVAEEHHGSIGVRDASGGGSEFWLSLPPIKDPELEAATVGGS
jgi:two-component system sensor histidine kinase MprB